MNVSARQVKRGLSAGGGGGALGDKITFWLGGRSGAAISLTAILTRSSPSNPHFTFAAGRNSSSRGACRLLRPGRNCWCLRISSSIRPRTANIPRALLSAGSSDRFAWQIPMCNLQPIDTYLGQLRTNGFQDIVAIGYHFRCHSAVQTIHETRACDMSVSLRNRLSPAIPSGARRLQLKLGFLDGLHLLHCQCCKRGSIGANHHSDFHA